MSCFSMCPLLSKEAWRQRRVAWQQRREIEEQLTRERKEKNKEINILSLGAEGSGKSTFMKQMRIIHDEGYSTSDRQNFVVIIHRNIYIAMQQLLEAMKHLKIPYQTELPEGTSNILLSIKPDVAQQITPEVKAMMAAVWRDGGIQTCFSRRREFKISDSAKYYLDDLDRITAEEYLPTQQDILNAYVPTTDLNEYIFIFNGVTFRMIEIGRQKSLERRWLYLFADISSLMFFIALSEYDQSPDEVNRMKEALDQFSNIVSSPWLSKSAIILLLNKKDLFEEKIMTSHLVDYFPEYTGPKCDHIQAREFIAKLFINVHPERSTDIYPHFLCATDTECMEFSSNFLFDHIKNHILQQHIVEVIPDL